MMSKLKKKAKTQDKAKRTHVKTENLFIIELRTASFKNIKLELVTRLDRADAELRK